MPARTHSVGLEISDEEAIDGMRAAFLDGFRPQSNVVEFDVFRIRRRLATAAWNSFRMSLLAGRGMNRAIAAATLGAARLRWQVRFLGWTYADIERASSQASNVAAAAN